MYPLVYKYLVINKKVSVPGIGNFLIDTAPAFIEQGNQLQPPVSHILFKPETALADKKFYEFLAAEMHIDDIDAIKRFHEFAYELKGNASFAEGLQFPGIGTLKKQPNGSFAFQEEKSFVQSYKPIQLSQAIVAEKRSTKETPAIAPDYSDIELTPVAQLDDEAIRDFWWVYAIILALIGIGAIVYYYL